MATEITYRAQKGSQLTSDEVDANFKSLTDNKAELEAPAFKGRPSFNNDLQTPSIPWDSLNLPGTFANGIFNFTSRPKFNGSVPWDANNLPVSIVNTNVVVFPNRPMYATFNIWDSGNLISPVDVGTADSVQAGRNALGVGMVLLASLDFSQNAVAEADFPNVFTDEFDDYEIVVTNLAANVGNFNLALQLAQGGATYITTPYAWQLYYCVFGNTSQAYASNINDSSWGFGGAQFGTNANTGAKYTTAFTIRVYGMRTANSFCSMEYRGAGVSGGVSYIINGGGTSWDTHVKTGFRLIMTQITGGATKFTGRCKVFGIK